MAFDFLVRTSDLLLLIAILISTAFTIFLATLPTQYDPLGRLKQQGPGAGETSEEQKFKNVMHKRVETNVQAGEKSIQIVVLGDIGRSPRMQYHAISFAKHGGNVQLVGYLDSEVHPSIKAFPNIHVVPLVPTPSAFQTSSKLLFLLLAPLKVLWQIWTLYHTLGYRTTASKYIMVQNPPSIPTLAICSWLAFFRNSALVIDWHNFGFSILALKLGPSHPLVRISLAYERFFAAKAWRHFAVTDAMVQVLREEFGVEAKTLHDRPADQFRPLGNNAKTKWLLQCADTKEYATDLLAGRWRLVVSSTSWTPDEDFSILLDALQDYSARAGSSSTGLPKLLVVITGKGPQKQHYLSKVTDLNQQGKLTSAVIRTAWLSTEDYAHLLGAADLGVSLHTSSSGVDLPMKVVDMFGAGLPVVAARFKALPELVREGENGRSFTNASELAALLVELLGGGGRSGPDNELIRLRDGAVRDGARRWNEEWDSVAGQVFHLTGEGIGRS